MTIETFRQALQNVLSNKVRSFLTMLGIIIGVAAVIVIVGLGRGMTNSVQERLSATLGLNTLNINVWPQGSRIVPVDTVYKIVDDNPDLFESVSPSMEISGTVKVYSKTYRQTTTFGVDEKYLDMRNYELAEGRTLQYMDIEDNKQVCVIGAYLNRVAYGGNAVGQTIKVGDNKLRIVGVLKAKIDSEKSQQGTDDDRIYMPYTTALRLTSQTSVTQYLAIMADSDRSEEAKQVMEDGLYKAIRSEDNYYVYGMSEWLQETNDTINLIIMILTAIAGISLLVGGIGIMNIMLVSVTERTREIGIRKAMGAKERVILAQFVTEAGVTSALGGVLGIVFGYVISYIVNFFMPAIVASTGITDRTEIRITPTIGSVVAAFAISVGIGVLFGYLPARRAARLNPIDALRYE